MFFTGQNPCCAIGHAIQRIPGAKENYNASFYAPETIQRAADALGLTVADVVDITKTNDHTVRADRKDAVMELLNELEASCCSTS